MKRSFLLCPLVALVAASSAQAATIYVSPTATATSGCSLRSTACALGAGVAQAMPGDTVVLMDGVYKTPLYPDVSGTPDAWITFKADQCATPIIEGAGAAPDADSQDTGVGSTKSEYIRFEGIVSRGWNIGFGNAWAGGTEEDRKSNGNWQVEHCISYSNGRTGFTFFSADNFSLKHSISAHNGTSTVHSWSSGVTLFEASGTNLVEGSISFENTDEQKHTDGSGFIVDEESNGVLFLNNIAFGNSGSCFRLTRSGGTKFINNTCYRNTQFGSKATGPTDPGEIYFTGNGGPTVVGVTFKNNVIVATGEAPAGSIPIHNQPTSGWESSTNIVTTNAAMLFTDATATNPNFVPAMGATTLVGKATSGNGAPDNDIGFDPKCLVKRKPVMVGAIASLSHWQFDVDIDYIKSLGGVAKCFNPGMRSAPSEIGAYKKGAITTIAPGSCVPPPPDPVVMMGGAGGMAAGGGTSLAGASSAGGSPSAQGGASSAAGGPSNTTGGSPAATGGAAPTAGNASSNGGVVGAGGSSSGVAGGPQAGAPVTPAPTEASGCGCRVATAADARHSFLALAAVSLGLAVARRRRQSRSPR